VPAEGAGDGAVLPRRASAAAVTSAGRSAFPARVAGPPRQLRLSDLAGNRLPPRTKRCPQPAAVRADNETAGVLPTDTTLLLEASRDQLGDWQVLLLSPLGTRLHLTLRLALEGRLRERPATRAVPAPRRRTARASD
jgi:hypothetical protein